jgi:hypothetical protein
MLAYEWRVFFAKIARAQGVASETSAGPQGVKGDVTDTRHASFFIPGSTFSSVFH